jgi:phosphomannomutase
VLEIAENSDFKYADVNDLGKVTLDDSWLQKHIDLVLALPLVDVEAIKKADFKL